uniref:Uncharacterized protein n=1 Tax=Aegilops tauschii subsp. strangulata TaxID=200361 RepID=A0A453BJI1_AEGTS
PATRKLKSDSEQIRQEPGSAGNTRCPGSPVSHCPNKSSSQETIGRRA